MTKVGRAARQGLRSPTLKRPEMAVQYGDDDQKEKQTSECFSYKWKKEKTYDSDAMAQKSCRWLIERYFGNEGERNKFLTKSKGKRFLDAGCGSGFSASILFGRDLNEMEYLGVDISDSVKTAQERFQRLGLRGEFVKESISTMNLGKHFDVIFCEGVLHHTANPFQSLTNLVRHLERNGVIMFIEKRQSSENGWMI